MFTTLFEKINKYYYIGPPHIGVAWINSDTRRLVLINSFALVMINTLSSKSSFLFLIHFLTAEMYFD